MRIPISKADLIEGRFTKIARALQKQWTATQLSLMQSQNLLAGLLGYRNLHELQQCAGTESVSPTKLTTRKAIATSVAWQMYRRHGVPLDVAIEKVKHLRLKTLDVDKGSTEAGFEREQERAAASGKLLMIDEAWELMNPKWEPRTPKIIESGIPAYRYAIFPDKRIFSWWRLESLLGLLPNDFMVWLRDEARYASVSDDETLEMKFIREELYPQAIQPLRETIIPAGLLPEGCEILWVFEATGECVGRVIHNHDLGGIIPVVYGISDNSIFDAIGALLCGEVIARPDDGDECAEMGEVYVLSGYFKGSGYDFARDTSSISDEKAVAGNLINSVPKTQICKLHEGIHFKLKSGAARCVCGPTFIENGQEYIRYQPAWVKLSEIPEDMIHIVGNLSTQEQEAATVGYTNSNDALPVAALTVHRRALEVEKALFDAARSRVCSEGGARLLVSLIEKLVEPDIMNGYCDHLIDEYLPVRYEGESEDSEELRQERSTEMARLEASGNEILEIIPGLTGIKPAGVGMFLLLANGEYPGSRYCWAVESPKSGDWASIVRLLGCIATHAISCRQGGKESPGTFDDDVLCFAADQVITLGMAPDTLLKVSLAMTRYRKRSLEEGKFIEKVESWRRSQAVLDGIREDGQFLYVRTQVEMEKPISPLEQFYRLGRKTSNKLIEATQEWQSFSTQMGS